MIADLSEGSSLKSSLVADLLALTYVATALRGEPCTWATGG